MEPYRNLLHYNAWANARLTPVLEGLDAEQLEVPVEGMYGSIRRTFAHVLEVEEGYLELMGAGDGHVSEERAGRSIAELVAKSQEANAAYTRWSEGLTSEELGRHFHIPWFDSDLSVGDGIIQVVTHSIEHRADLANALSRAGVKTPMLDYVVFRLGLNKPVE